ncbi:outer membrane protein/protective antigen OMA87 [Belliella baltica DSM 15883]|uniref:Outer membrane protein/protective antigen OMA87 n=1 Tax=Belliella baltica (strain DSM 15883 / CIP 108006 / LMG 21964 / BA134) TaxID=866536 RepID=I3Z9K6_BELBD|nr:BamA/TamA family outer membrane protein [Belliella baltica]AFL85924.1 outer membrane protein/protective antigen OMA87 [Belliella baltica DSM 15883]
MKIKSVYILSFGFLLAFSEACSVKKFIPEDERLYIGAELSLKSEESLKDFKEVKTELEGLVRPEPNTKILGMYFGLWAHYKGSKEKPGFINRFLKKKLGEEPVYFSKVDPGKTEELIINRLENKGFFYSSATSEVNRGEKFASINYQVNVTKPYTLRNFKIDRDSLEIDKEIKTLMEETELKEGNRFDLSLLKNERERLDEALKDLGYYNFNANYLIFEADTNVSDKREFDLFLRLKSNTPSNGVIPYVVNNIRIFPNYSVMDEEGKIDTVTIDGKDFIQGVEVFKPELLEQYVLLEKGALYSPKKSRLTSNRLSSIGNYRFVNLRYDELEDSVTKGNLDANIYLSPLNKRSIRVELQGVSKSNNFAGPALNVIYRNRNLFHGGETLNLTAKFAYENQLAGGQLSGLNSIELGLKADLIFPRVVFFIPIKERFSYSVPKTKMSLGTEYQSRGGLYRLNTFSANYGYYWNANRFVYHEINPISLNLVNLTRTSPEFEQILDNNPFLRRSFEQQFIAGINYTFNYNKLSDRFRTHGIFFGAGLDLAGNGFNLANTFLGTEQGTFLGLNYAQYARGDLDLRYYWRPNQKHTIATRIFGGLGLPYGNSESLPFVKQFFAGGPNSVRAFRIRGLGPGTYRPEQVSLGSFFDQAGDVRLEGNIEYRFPLVSVLKGALFVDAGNVWLVNENEALPGGKFTSNWWNEMAVGAGFGARIDIEFFVIRFDLATPLRVPYLPENERWGNTFDIKSRTWRRENLIFNFAIGYPF